MESTKYEKIESIELYKYTKEQLAIKNKIQLGVILDNDDYSQLYYDLLTEFNDIIEDEKQIQDTYIDFLNRKYNCTFKLSIIQDLILNQFNNKSYFNN